MRRRDFIAGLGGATVAWPLAVQAQQTAMPVIGFLSTRSPRDSDTPATLAALRRGLAEAGYVEGRNVAFEFRWAEGQYDRLPAMAAELVLRRVAVLIAIATPSTHAAKAATTTIPILFTIGGDPIELGVVSSLNRPGGNITGVSILANVLVAKQLEVLQQLVPKADAFAQLVNPSNPTTETDMREAQLASNALGKKLVVGKASDLNGVEAAFASFAEQGVGGVLVQSESLFHGHPDRIVAGAARHALPAVYPIREYAVAGGLMSYGTSLPDAMFRLGAYAGRILKGEKSGDLPVQQAVKVELIVNLKTAKALGIEVPQILLARADEVIE